jgi:PTS system ascorbate-specific IIA component
MTTNVLLITHDNVGNALLNTIYRMLGKLPLPTISLPIKHDDDPEYSLTKIHSLVANLRNDKNLLILTDVFGATPSNIARLLPNNTRIKIITGVNLPMLIRVMNYAHLSLEELAEKAIHGGKEGVMQCQHLH